MMFAAHIFALALLFLLICHFWKKRRSIYLLSKIPKISVFDLTVKNVYNFYRGDSRVLFKVLSDVGSRTKEVAVVKFMPVLLIIVTSPEDVKFILNSKHCIDKPYFIKEFPKLSQGTLFGYIERWKVHRKILDPYFGLQSLKSIIPIFNKKVDILMMNLREMEGRGEFNVFNYMTALTLETILSVMEFDVDIQNQKGRERDGYIRNLEKYGTAVALRTFKFWLHPSVLYNLSSVYRYEQKAATKCAFVFAPKIIENVSKRSANDVKEKRPLTFVRALTNERHNLKNSEILDEIKTLLIAAQDTSAIASSSVLLLLAMHKDKQDKVMEELEQVLGTSAENFYIDIEQLNDLKYLDMVINETMRLIPVVPIVGRINEQEITLSEKYVIPVGANLMIPIIGIHKNKDYWGADADVFRPERFERQVIENIHPYAFIPFAKGPRMCIGWRYASYLMKIQLAKFLMCYEVDTSLKLQELEFKFGVTLNICQGHQTSIRSRKK